MIRKSFALALFIFAVQLVLAQKYTVSGYITDAASGEGIIGAYVVDEKSNMGAVTNVYGFYSLSLPEGTYELTFKYISYRTIKKVVDLRENKKINIELVSSDTELEEVTVYGEAENRNVSNAETGVTDLSPKEIEVVPVLFGEKDILKTIQLLPGVKAAGEGNSGYYVRGGGADENMILLDDAPVYNASHMMGFFSVFNSDAVKNVKLYKGTAPAQYGGRLSSVLDIKMNDGNMKKLTGSGGIGMISSKLKIEGPIVKDKASFIVSGRRTYADLFLIFAKKEEQRNSTLYFYDLNSKVNWRINNKNRLYLSGYFGRDVFGFSDMFGIDWGNRTGTLRWNHVFGDKLFLNSTLLYSDYDYTISLGIEDGEVNIISGIRNQSIKEDFQYFVSPNNKLRFGLSSIYHVFHPGEIATENLSIINDKKVKEHYGFENAAYISHEAKPADWLKLNYGLRFSTFCALGPNTVYEFNAIGDVVDSTVYATNEIIKTYKNIEPRVTANFLLNEKNSVKFSYTRNSQYLHLLSNTTASSPTDIWYPATDIVQPGIANLYSAGYYRNFNDNMFESYIEIYYKGLENLIDYKNGANVLLNEYLESELVFGHGYSYGAEFYFKKRLGKFTGWISYTWSRTQRQFNEINKGEIFPARQDRIHDFSITAIYMPTPRLSLSASWVYYTGDAVTFPSGLYIVNGLPVSLYTERNGYRMPDYHRGDISVTWENKERKYFNSSWNLSIYNVYARKNAFQISFQQKEDNSGEFEAVRLALFSIVPAISFTFEF
ncbi:MAG: TonB-dependent receptor [Bacteroidota bacterium]|nr:TonB-dependent receptor [Bacteroidota bacterium]